MQIAKAAGGSPTRECTPAWGRCSPLPSLGIAIAATWPPPSSPGVRYAGHCGAVRRHTTSTRYSASPVALFGVAYSIVALAASIVWWRAGDRRALYLLYGMGLLGLLAVIYLTYLELFVIEAVCVWCVSYAVTVVGGWIVAVIALRADGRRA